MYELKLVEIQVSNERIKSRISVKHYDNQNDS